LRSTIKPEEICNLSLKPKEGTDMLRLKRFAAIMLLALVASFGAPQAFAGDISCPDIVGETPTPGYTGPQESPGATGGIEMPGLNGEILTPGLAGEIPCPGITGLWGYIAALLG
jgi:hypothetical protein